MLKLTYDVLGAKKGDAIAEVYRSMLKLELPIDVLNEQVSNIIISNFKKELERYCKYTGKLIENYVAYDIVEELQTYHYL